MAKEIKTIGVMTSGGDAPGMNAAIRAVVRAALSSGLEVKGIRRGYAGLLEEDIIDMHTMSVTDIVQRGGTILFTSRCEEMRTPEGQEQIHKNIQVYKNNAASLMNNAYSLRRVNLMPVHKAGLSGT